MIQATGKAAVMALQISRMVPGDPGPEAAADTSRCAQDDTCSVCTTELGSLKAGWLVPLPKVGLDIWETAFLELL